MTVALKPVFLIGYMGSGKTTLGHALGMATGLRFIDLDQYIEACSHTSITDIFATRGEAEFRRIERDMLREVSRMDDVIVACGGGTPCHFDNMDFMNSCGTTIMLDASIDRLFERLKAGRSQRPLIASLSDELLRTHITDTLESRLPFYTKARHTFPADRLDDTEQIAESVQAFITRFIHRS